MSSLGGFIAGMLMLSLVFSAFCFIIGLAIKIIKGALGRR